MTTTTETRRESLDAITDDITPLQKRVIELFETFQPLHGLTADEVAKWLGKSPFSIRPRITELLEKGIIEETGEKRHNVSGRPAAVVRLVKRQRELF